MGPLKNIENFCESPDSLSLAEISEKLVLVLVDDVNEASSLE